MSEHHRYEAERSAWIKSRRWPNKPAADRRADQLGRRARQLTRSGATLTESSVREAEAKGAFGRWTHHDDTTTSALGFVAFSLVYGIVLPVWLGLTWAIGWATYRLWDLAADKHRVRIWPYVVAAALAGALFVMGRGAGWDLWLIHLLADFLETATGGFLAPAALSRWYAAGWVSWLQIQVVLGLLYGGWSAYAWGWTAPAVRARATGEAGKTDKSMQILKRGHDAAA